MKRDTEYRRAKCPACNVLCEQRRRAVLFPDGEKRLAYDCIECEVVYLVAEPAVTVEEKVRL